MPPPALPDAVDRSYKPFTIDTPGRWGVMNDTHLPYHDKPTIEGAVRQWKRDKVTGLLLNGDILDFHSLSRFDHDPSAPRYCQEIEAGKALLAYLRHMLGKKIRIVYKLGNHEARLRSYLTTKALELFGLEELTLPSLLQLDQYGVELVDDHRLIRMGRLNIIHGHEYGGGGAGGLHPAKTLYNKASSNIMAGHVHRSDHYRQPTLDGDSEGAWVVGCACELHPAWLPLNKWTHGWACVDLQHGGEFSVRNFRAVNGVAV